MSRFLNKAGDELDVFADHLQRKGSIIPNDISETTSLLISSSNHYSSVNTSNARRRPSKPQHIKESAEKRLDRVNAHAKNGKLGTMDGVFIPVCLSIWGVVLFLRFGFILGQAGLIATLAMFTIGYLITSTTTLSLSAISTNGTVRGGGPYYMISRTLGPEFGGSIGLIFCLGNVLSGAMSLLGLIETLLANLGQKGGSMWQVLPQGRMYEMLYSSILLMLCSVVCMIGTKIFARATLMLAFILFISTLSIMASLAFRAPFENSSLGVVFPGWSVETLNANLWPALDVNAGVDLKQMFAIVFPACTGILTGASMSGDLKNPSRSIPSGTLGAVGFTYMAYTSMGFLMAGAVHRDTLKTDLSVMQDIAILPVLVTIGILATSLFCTLGSIIGAANILQAIGKDDILKPLKRFAYGRSTDNNPTTAILITWILIQCLVFFMKDIDDMASFVTMFSLLTFGVMNLACFLLRITGSVNFRPSFNYFNWKTAFFGMFCCFMCMLYVDPLSASLSCFILICLFAWIHYTCPPKSWGDVMQSLIYHQVRKYLLRLDSRKEHVKFWRPQILILIDSPQENYLLIKFMNDLKKGGLYVLGHVLKGDFSQRMNEFKKQMPGWLRFVDIGKIKAFVELTIAKNERIGAQNLMLGSGLGAMKPNIVVLGFFDVSKQHAAYDSDDNLPTTSGKGARISTSTWSRVCQPKAAPFHSPSIPFQWNPFKKNEPPEDPVITASQVAQDPLCSDLPKPSDVERGISVENYVGIIEDALSLNKAVAIARHFENLNDTPFMDTSPSVSRRNSVKRWTTLVKEEYRRVSYFFNDSLSKSSGKQMQPLDPSQPFPSPPEEYHIPVSSVMPPLKKRFIDIWPIQMACMAPGSAYKYSFDTYTMVLQLGCILHMQDYWKDNYQLRVNAFVEDYEDARAEEERVKMLLKGLRIDAQVKMVWLRSTNGVKSDSEEYEAHLQLHRKQQRGKYIKEQRQRQPKTSPMDQDVFTLAPSAMPIVDHPHRKRRSTVSMLSTRLPTRLVKHVGAEWPLSPTLSPTEFHINMSDSEDEGVSTHKETQSESSGSSTLLSSTPSLPSPSDDPCMDSFPSSPPFIPPPSLFNSLDAPSQHLVLNQLMCRHSSSQTTALIFSTLPAPDPGTAFSRERSHFYVELLDILTHDLPPIVLVHGKGLTVTMSL